MSSLFQPFPMLPGRAAQVWHHHPSFRRPRHFHAEPELNVVVRGQGVLAVGEVHLKLSAGDVVFLQPGQDHELLSESQDFELFVLAVTPRLAARCGLHATRRLGVVSLDNATVAALRDTWIGLGQVADVTAVENTLCDAFKRLTAHFAASASLCRRVLSSMHAAPECSEKDLAAQLRSHPSCVSRSIRSNLGVSLVQYRSRMRLMAFVNHVDAGATLTQAAMACGFGSYAQLHRCFRRHFTCAPVDYFSGERHVVDGLLQRDVSAFDA